MLPRSGKVILGLGLGLTFLVAACATVPYTGRRQLLMGSEAGEISSGSQIFQALRRQYPACGDPAINDLVFRVGSRIAAAANRPDYHWEFVVLVNDKEANAFCLPGGKVGIFTGLLKYTRDEAGLATVISHEAAHALARHAGERRSQGLLAQIGGLGLGLGLGGVGSAAGQAISQGYSLGTQYGILLPYSRTQELEADKIGLILMAKAGYDPALALDFWRRMMAKEDHKLRPPQFMSTHPRDLRPHTGHGGFSPRGREALSAAGAGGRAAAALDAPAAGLTRPAGSQPTVAAATASRSGPAGREGPGSRACSPNPHPIRMPPRMIWT